jgi:hypothetical protein
MITICCEVCGEPFEVKPYRVKTARFCSFKCSGFWHARQRLNTGSKPHMRGNKYRLGKKPTNAGIPSELRGDKHPKWTPRLSFTCAFCEATFQKVAWLARKHDHTNRFCSALCRSRYRSVFLSGSNAPDWKGGRVNYRGLDWPQARTQVIVEQRGYCAHCEVFKGKSLPVHHIKPFREFPTSKEANRRDNLIGLCQRCHMKVENARR